MSKPNTQGHAAALAAVTAAGPSGATPQMISQTFGISDTTSRRWLRACGASVYAGQWVKVYYTGEPDMLALRRTAYLCRPKGVLGQLPVDRVRDVLASAGPTGIGTSALIKAARANAAKVREALLELEAHGVRRFHLVRWFLTRPEDESPAIQDMAQSAASAAAAAGEAVSRQASNHKKAVPKPKKPSTKTTPRPAAVARQGTMTYRGWTPPAKRATEIVVPAHVVPKHCPPTKAGVLVERAPALFSGLRIGEYLSE